MLSEQFRSRKINLISNKLCVRAIQVTWMFKARNCAIYDCDTSNWQRCMNELTRQRWFRSVSLKVTHMNTMMKAMVTAVIMTLMIRKVRIKIITKINSFSQIKQITTTLTTTTTIAMTLITIMMIISVMRDTLYYSRCSHKQTWVNLHKSKRLGSSACRIFVK